jgi:hypothetical protein
MNFPFYYQIIDNFFNQEQAKTISKEFPEYNSDIWYCYNNPLENKKTCNNWYQFGPETYKTLTMLNSKEFIRQLQKITGIPKLYPDIGLHGGPKLKLQRKLNLIIYLEEDWNQEWGGNLELWSHNKEKNKPDKRFVKIDNVFNRAVLFDTTKNSWHGFPDPLTCPEGKYRKSLAVYYLTDPSEGTDPRPRALYAPTKEQENNPEILKLIEERVKL